MSIEQYIKENEELMIECFKETNDILVQLEKATDKSIIGELIERLSFTQGRYLELRAELNNLERALLNKVANQMNWK